MTMRANRHFLLHPGPFDGKMYLLIHPASGAISPAAGIRAASPAATYERSAIHG